MILTTLQHWHMVLATLSFWDCVQWTVDVLIVSVLIYYLMMLAKGTRAWQVLWGLVVFALLLLVSQWTGLQTQQLDHPADVLPHSGGYRHSLPAGIAPCPGRGGALWFWGRGFVGLATEDVSDLVGEIVRAAGILSNRRAGALIVIERETGLVDIIETGTAVNAVVSAELLGTIFYPGSPLHDGARHCARQPDCGGRLHAATFRQSAYWHDYPHAPQGGAGHLGAKRCHRSGRLRRVGDHLGGI